MCPEDLQDVVRTVTPCPHTEMRRIGTVIEWLNQFAVGSSVELMTKLPLPFFSGLLLLAGALTAGCDDGVDDPEPDSSVIVLERQLARDAVMEASFAVAEVDGAAWAALGTEIVRIAEPQRSDSIAVAERVHGSIVSDDRYVYYATQSKRVGVDAHTPTSETRHDDGQLFRARRDGTGTPEKIFDVGILVGAFALQGGHLYVCESAGLNTSGSLVDITLGEDPSAKRVSFRMNEYCEGVVADDSNVFLAMNASYKALVYGGDDPKIVSFPKTIELARVTRSALGDDFPWMPDDGPERFATTTLSPGIHAMHLTEEGIVLGRWSQSIRVSLDGVETALPAAAPLSLSIPDQSAWLDATAGTQTNMKDDTCHGGRLYRRDGDRTTELTQAVCEPEAMAAGEALWLVESADLYDAGMVNPRTRIRVKRIDRRAP